VNGRREIRANETEGSDMSGAGRPIHFGSHPPREGGRKFDALPPEVAVRLAWTDAGSMPRLLSIRQDAVREIMPNLARALDRLSAQRPEVGKQAGTDDR
jgi:hypothetical protein